MFPKGMVGRTTQRRASRRPRPPCRSPGPAPRRGGPDSDPGAARRALPASSPPPSLPAPGPAQRRGRGRAPAKGAVAAAVTAAPRPRGRHVPHVPPGRAAERRPRRGSGSSGGARHEAGAAAARSRLGRSGPRAARRPSHRQPQPHLGLRLRPGARTRRSGPSGLLRALLAVPALHEAVPGLR